MKILSFKLGGHVSFGPKVKKEEAVWGCTRYSK